MKILLFEEYSGLHTLLAKGLKELGHEVTLVGNGNMFHNYPRDIDIKRHGNGVWGGIRHAFNLFRLLPKFKGYDIVQLINPDCFGLKAKRQYFFYNYLKRNNKKLLVGAFGCDWYWVDDGVNHKTFRYGDFYIGDKMRDDAAAKVFIDDYLFTEKGDYTRYAMENADWIPTCLYEYQAVYSRYFPHKTTFIPLPIQADHEAPVHVFNGFPIRFFIGIDNNRSAYKGTDIMLRALESVAKRHPEEVEMVKAVSLPFEEYTQAMNSSDIMLDQLYSYTPSMNSLLAMQRGIVVVGGGEPENYDIINEKELRPIINVEPSQQSVEEKLEWIIAHPELLNRMKEESIAYVKKHHQYNKVARQYADMYESLF